MGVLLAAGPILTPWLVIPIISVAMLLVAGHTLAIQRVEMPASRRRIRTANGLIMLVALPMLAYALCIAGPHDKRLFVLAWTAVMGLVGMVIVLALLDIANNLRLYGRGRGEIDQLAAEALAERFKARARSGAGGDRDGH